MLRCWTRRVQKERAQKLTVRPGAKIERATSPTAHRTYTHFARPQTRSDTTHVCGRYDRPQLAGVGSAQQRCYYGSAVAQLRARCVVAVAVVRSRQGAWAFRAYRPCREAAVGSECCRSRRCLSVLHAEALHVVCTYAKLNSAGLGWPQEASGIRQ